MTSSETTSSSSILSRIRSLTDRKTAKRSSSEPSTREGSSKDQCSLLTAPGKNGHASLASSQAVAASSVTHSRNESNSRSIGRECSSNATPLEYSTWYRNSTTC